ncbi:MAG: GNAT family N-acetyltransferase [Phycisphaerales bacterium]|nr:GNAT family N-acetyltransferase [Phycisphaerales bacterium]
MSKSDPVSSVAALGGRIGPAIERHFDTTFRALLHGPGTTIDPNFIRLLTNEPHPFGNLAVVAERNDPDVTRQAIEPLCAAGCPAAVAFPGTPVSPAVESLLASRGFAPHAAMPAMAVDIDRLAPTALPAGYSFVRTSDDAAGAAWTECFAVGYELPLAVARYFSPMAAPGHSAPEASVQFFAVLKDHAPVATSMVYLADGLAGVYCVATVPEERGKGIGAHVTAQALRAVQQLGYRVGVLQSSEMGESVYRRIGFETFGGVPLYVLLPSG